MAGMTLGNLSLTLTANVSRFTRSLKTAVTSIEKLKRKTDSLGRSTTNVAGITAKHWNALARIVKTSNKNMEKSMKVLSDTMKLNSDKMAAAARNYQAKIGAANKGTMASMLSLKSFMMKIVHYLTFTVGVQMVMMMRQGFESLVEGIKEFESNAINAATVAGYLGASFDGVVDHLMNVSKEIGSKTIFSIQEVSKAFYSLASAGYDVADMYAKDLLPITEYATAVNMDLDMALQSITKTMKQFKIEFDDVTSVVDAFTTVITNTYATAEKMAEGMKYVGAITGVLRQDINEVSSALGILYDRGLEGGQAGQRLNMIFTKLLKPSEKARKNLDAMGLTLDEINPRTHDFVDILYTLQAANFDAADAASMFRARTAGTAVMLVEAADEVANLTNEIRLNKGVTGEIASKQLTSLNNQLKLLSNETGALSSELRTSIIPAFSYLTDIIRNQVLPGIEGTAKFFENLVGVLRGLRPILDALIPVLMTLTTTMITMWVAGKLLAITLGQNAVSAVVAASGFRTLKTALMGTLGSSFLIASSMMGLGFVLGEAGGAINALIPAVIALNLAYRLHLGVLRTVGVETMVFTALKAKTITMNQLETLSTGVLTKAYLSAIWVRAKYNLSMKASALWSGILIAKNALLAVGILVVANLIAATTVLTVAETIANTNLATSTWAATAATWALNAALWANPLVWIAIAIVGVIAGVILLAAAFGDTTNAQEDQIKTTKEEEEAFKDLDSQLLTCIESQKALEDSTKRLSKAEGDLDDMREDGLETTQEYIDATNEFSDAFEEHRQIVENTTKVTQDYLDSGADLIKQLRLYSAVTDNIINKTAERLKLESSITQDEERSLKLKLRIANAQEEYTETLVKFGKDSDEAGKARDDLVSVENDYWDVTKEITNSREILSDVEKEILKLTKDATKAELMRAQVAEKILEAQRAFMDLERKRSKLLAEQAALLRAVTKGNTMYEEEMKSVWERILKVYEAELALYKLRKEQPELMDDLFEKMASYGMVTREIIDLYVAMKEAQKDLWAVQDDYYKAFQGFSEEQQDAVGEIIKRYQELREEGMSAAEAWAQAQIDTDFDLSGMGINAGDIQTVWNFAEAEWALVDASQALYDVVIPALEKLGGLDFADLPTDLKAILTELMKLNAEEPLAFDKWIEAINDLNGAMIPFADIATQKWLGLIDTFNESPVQTWMDMVDSSDVLTQAALDNEGAFGILAKMFGYANDEAVKIAIRNGEISDSAMVAAAAILEFASHIDAIDLTDLGTRSVLLDQIEDITGMNISGGFDTLDTHISNSIGDSASLYDVLQDLAGILEQINNTMISVSMNTAAMAAGGYENWGESLDSVLSKWGTLQDYIDEGQSIEGWLSTVEGKEEVDGFVRYLYQAFPTNIATEYALDFTETYGDIAGIEDGVSGLMEWLNTQGWTFAIEEVVDSEAFKNKWIDDLGGLSTYLTTTDFPASIIMQIEGKEWTGNFKAVLDKKELDLQGIIKNWDLRANIVLTIDEPEVPEIEKQMAFPSIADLLDYISSWTKEDIASVTQPVIDAGLDGYQSGGIIKGPQQAIIGEAGAEAVIPLEGTNKKYGMDLLNHIIPKYFPDLMAMQTGGIVGSPKPINAKLGIFEDILKVLKSIETILIDNIVGKLPGGIISPMPMPTPRAGAPVPVGAGTSAYAQTATGYFDADIGVRQGGKKINVGIHIDASEFNTAIDSFITSISKELDSLLESFNTTASQLETFALSSLPTAAGGFYTVVKNASDYLRNQIDAVTPIKVVHTHTITTKLVKFAQGGIVGAQRGGVAQRPTLGVFGEAGAEALIPLEGKNKKFGKDLLQKIIPEYYPDLMQQTGGVYGAGSITYGGDSNQENYNIYGAIELPGVSRGDEFAAELARKFKAAGGR